MVQHSLLPAAGLWRTQSAVGQTVGHQPLTGASIDTGALATAAAQERPEPRGPGRPHGIRANCIAPETILTEKNKAWIPNSSSRNWSNPTRCGGLGTPQDVARAAVYLASDEASWITGVVLDISGGSVMV